MQDEANGFTLVELLVVLFVIQLLLGLSSNYYSVSKDLYTFKRWYEQFELDLLEAQKRTMISQQNYSIELYPRQHRYHCVTTTFAPVEFTRDIPLHFQFPSSTAIIRLRFARSGTFRDPSSFRIKTKHYTHTIYFPFGKGRSYVVSEKK